MHGLVVRKRMKRRGAKWCYEGGPFKESYISPGEGLGVQINVDQKKGNFSSNTSAESLSGKNEKNFAEKRLFDGRVLQSVEKRPPF